MPTAVGGAHRWGGERTPALQGYPPLCRTWAHRRRAAATPWVQLRSHYSSATRPQQEQQPAACRASECSACCCPPARPPQGLSLAHTTVMSSTTPSSSCSHLDQAESTSCREAAGGGGEGGGGEAWLQHARRKGGGRSLGSQRREAVHAGIQDVHVQEPRELGAECSARPLPRPPPRPTRTKRHASSASVHPLTMSTAPWREGWGSEGSRRMGDEGRVTRGGVPALVQAGQMQHPSLHTHTPLLTPSALLVHPTHPPTCGSMNSHTPSVARIRNLSWAQMSTTEVSGSAAGSRWRRVSEAGRWRAPGGERHAVQCHVPCSCCSTFPPQPFPPTDHPPKTTHTRPLRTPRCDPVMLPPPTARPGASRRLLPNWAAIWRGPDFPHLTTPPRCAPRRRPARGSWPGQGPSWWRARRGPGPQGCPAGPPAWGEGGGVRGGAW